MRKEISSQKYNKKFHVNDKDSSINKKALNYALDIRKFEIEMYWKRAAYFWTFIAASFAGYFIVQQPEYVKRENLSLIISGLGLVFSFGWYCVNRGSKQWQENWENHVDLLEDDVIGPLYKTITKRPKFSEYTNSKLRLIWENLKKIIVGPANISVSKVNQIISLYVTFIWIFLFYKTFRLCDNETGELNVLSIIILIFTFISCILFVTLGKTQQINFDVVVEKRKTKILDPD